MKAAIYRAFGAPLSVETAPDPAVPDDGVIIQVAACGVCRSDWHGWQGHDPDIHLPHVPGHELAGTIETVGKNIHNWQPGDRVTVPFACGCGRCRQCLAGNQHICDHYFQPGFTAWGGFAQFVAIEHAEVNLVRLPESIDFIAAASLGCRFITAFRAVVEQGQVSAGQWLVVHGCGGVGLSAIMIGRALGAQVIGVDINPAALTLAEALGAGHTLNATEEPDVIGAIHTLTGGGAHASLDALGSATTCRNSILSLRKQGRHVQVGLMAAEGGQATIPMSAVISKELQILGSHGMQAHAVPRILAMIEARTLEPARLVHRTISLAEAPAALVDMGEFQHSGVTVIDNFE